MAIKLFGDDLDQLLRTGGAIEDIVAGIAGAQDVKIEQVTGLPVLSVTPRRELLARYGINVADVQDAVSAAIGGRTAGQLFRGRRRFDIVVRLPEATRTDLNALKDLPIPVAGEGSGPAYVPLGEVATIEQSIGPNQISRENGKRRAVVTANVRGRDLGSFIAEAREEDRRAGDAAGGLLCRLWRHVRAVAVRRDPPSDCRAAGAAADLRAAGSLCSARPKTPRSSFPASRWR